MPVETVSGHGCGSLRDFPPQRLQLEAKCIVSVPQSSQVRDLHDLHDGAQLIGAAGCPLIGVTSSPESFNTGLRG